MGDAFHVLRYRRSDREEVFAFVDATHSHPARDRLLRQWDWKYEANPFNRDGEPYILLLRHGARLVGMLGTIPLRVFLDGREHWLSHSCDWMLHPDFRGEGLGRRLIAKHRADKPLRFSWQNDLSYRSLRQRTPGSYATIRPLVRPLDFTHVLRRTTARRLTRPTRGTRTAGADISVARVETVDERFGVLARRACRDHRALLVRDEAYLDWRFFRRPDAAYTVLAASRAGELLGYVVLRPAPDQAGVLWGYLVDFLVERRSRPLFALLLRSAIAYLRDAGAKGISCRALPPYRGVLYRHGFFPLWWRAPHHFHISLDLPDPAVRALEDVRQWHLTMGDGDLEMVF